MVLTHTSASIKSLLAEAGIPFPADGLARLESFVALLREWNTHINLISRKDEEQIWRNHILHSLAVLAVADPPRRGAMLDIGTGGGMPGIPLAIMLPEVRFTLVDSIAKKTRAVEEMAARLGLENVRVLRGRVEDEPLLAECRGTMDAVLARAVTALPALVRWSHPLLRPGGRRMLLAWKGGSIDDEIAEARRHGAVHAINEHAIVLPGEDYFVREEKNIIEVLFR